MFDFRLPPTLVSDIDRAAEMIRHGGIGAFPTETVYGLGSNAFDERAVARVFEVKQRPYFDPLIVHVADLTAARALAADFPPRAVALAEQFWPGPLTLVVPRINRVPDLVTAGLETVGLRVPDHPVALELLRRSGVPIAAPSANPFGKISPTTADHVREQLGDKIDFILDGGACRVGVESTVLQVTEGEVRLLRPGGTTVEEIEAVIGPVTVLDPGAIAEAGNLQAPGNLPQHYAPRTPLVIDGPEPGRRPQKTGLLALSPPSNTAPFVTVEVLSPTGDLLEAAANLFAALRRLDAQHLDLIVARLAPETGLGRAINDRLRRAAHRQEARRGISEL